MYCSACCEYPCSEYVHDAEYDSFITYQNRRRDLEKVQTIGQEAYKQEQLEKIDILRNLLDNYNDGRKKSFYCLSVNLLELEQLRAVMQALAQLPTMPKAEAAKYAEQLLREIAAKQELFYVCVAQRKIPDAPHVGSASPPETIDR